MGVDTRVLELVRRKMRLELSRNLIWTIASTQCFRRRSSSITSDFTSLSTVISRIQNRKRPLMSNESNSSAVHERNDSPVRGLLPTWIQLADSRSRRRFFAIALTIVLLGALLRLFGLFDDFWLDEIWSWIHSRHAKTYGDIFYGLHHDNNHYLNTLWIRFCGDQFHWYVYRLHSYVAGLITLWGVGWLTGDVAFGFQSDSSAAKDFNPSIAGPLTDEAAVARRVCLTTMFLAATWHMACIYSTEARGYALAMAAAVFSTIQSRRIVAGSSSRYGQFGIVFGYAILSIGGFLSHLSYATVFIPQFLWVSVQLIRRRDFVTIVLCYLPPAVTLTLLWIVDLRMAGSGGGPYVPFSLLGLQSLALPSGVDEPGWLIRISALLVFVSLIAGLIICREKSVADAWLFTLCALLAFPMMLGLRLNGLLYSRHFLVTWTVLLPVLGLAFAGVQRRSRVQTAARMLVPLALWLFTNGWEFSQFAVYGRGGYCRAVDWLVETTRKENSNPPRTFWVTSNHFFQDSTLLSFYLRRYADKTYLGYAMLYQLPEEGADWLILHSLDREYHPKQSVQLQGVDYDLAHFEPFAAPYGIGVHWAIYRRRTPAASQSN